GWLPTRHGAEVEVAGARLPGARSLGAPGPDEVEGQRALVFAPYVMSRVNRSSPPTASTNLSPAAAGSMRATAPESTTSPGVSSTPKLRSRLASQATALAGWPRAAAPAPRAPSPPERRSSKSSAARSPSSQSRRHSPSAKPPYDALSAIVSV